MRTYTITLNEAQAGTIQIACEVLARLGIGQFRDALEQLPTVEFMPPRSLPAPRRQPRSQGSAGQGGAAVDSVIPR